MSINNVLADYAMHSVIEEAYSHVHDLFDQDDEAKHYRGITWEEVKLLPSPDGIKDSTKRAAFAAAYFHYFFPTHHFKVCHALRSDKFIGQDRLMSWVRYNPHLLMLDIGCGDGAASTAFIDSLLRLRELKQLDPRPIQLLTIGIDLSYYRLKVYEHMMEATAQRSKEFGIDVQFATFPNSVRESIGGVTSTVQEIVKEVWALPSLHHGLAITANMMDLMKKQDIVERERLKGRTRLSSHPAPPLGKHLADFYLSVFDLVPMDHLHIVTIDTSPEDVTDIVQSAMRQLEHRLSGSRQIDGTNVSLDSIHINNPERSHWVARRIKPVRSTDLDPFMVSVAHVHSHDLAKDQRWKQILSRENMELAWARARYEALRESFCDEIELRLFEANLDANLERLSGELEAYAIRSGYLVLSYATPKDSNKGRPRGINRFEEEVLMVAMIQVIGSDEMRLSPTSYAYRLAPENSPERGATEYLYQRWSDSWLSFRTEIAKALKASPNGFALKYDITAFFTDILQARLKEIVRSDLRISYRIEWLLERLVDKQLDAHEVGKGLVQGGVGSGFLANLYLASIDRLFPVNDTHQRKLFRYVDDIVVVGAYKADEDATNVLVEHEISELQLQKHPVKSRSYLVDEYLEQLEPDTKLDNIRMQTDRLLNSLWQFDHNHRMRFSSASPHQSAWWKEVRGYRACLVELGIFMPIGRLSRLMIRGIQRADELPTDKAHEPLQYPNIPNTTSVEASRAWARKFHDSNPSWVVELQELRTEIEGIFTNSVAILSDPLASPESDSYVRAGRSARFALNRLAVLGFGEVRGAVVNMICSQPWHIRYHQFMLDALAIQGYSTELWQILDSYLERTDDTAKFILAAVIKAIYELPFLAKSDWEKVTNLMFSSDELVALMATQTWVSLNVFRKHVPLKDRVREEVIARLRTPESYSTHLYKNYLLVLGLVDSTNLAPFKVQLSDDPTLVAAFNIASGKSIPSLFMDVEPQVIRMKYYDAVVDAVEDHGPSGS